MKLVLDTETRSNVDLRDCGVYVYSEVPRQGDVDGFELLIVSYTFMDDDGVTDGVRVFSPLFDETPDEFSRALTDPSIVKVAHNAQFDRVVLSRGVYDAPDTFLDPAQWRDTMAMAGYRGMPKSLDRLSERLGIGRKLSEGKSLILFFNKEDNRNRLVEAMRRSPKRREKDEDQLRALLDLPRVSKDERELRDRLQALSDVEQKWSVYLDYCLHDTELLADVVRLLGDLPSSEQTVWELDQEINDRGILIDIELAKTCEDRAAELSDRAMARLKELTGIENPNSVVQMKTWLKGQGVETPSLDKEHVGALLSLDDLPQVVRSALLLRSAVSSSSVAKFTAMERRVGVDGIARGTFQYYGAHTGRWSGRGIQLQNLPRVGTDAEVERIGAMAEDLSMVREASMSDLKKLIRPCLYVPEGSIFQIGDFSAIEARVLAWLADEVRSLDAFERGLDPYRATYSAMSGIPYDQIGKDSEERQRGKVSDLAGGYGGGINAYKRMGGDKLPIPDDVKLRHSVLMTNYESEKDANPLARKPLPLTDYFLASLRDDWRRLNPNIVQLWGRLERAFRKAAFSGESSKVGKLHLSPFEHTYGDKTRRNNVRVVLPSGREMFYWGVRLRVERDEDGWEKENLVYTESDGRVIYTWGGKLTENVTQAVARDFLSDALVRIRGVGGNIVAHVHDEVIVEQRKNAPLDLKALLCERPSWAPDIPLNADVAESERYLGH